MIKQSASGNKKETKIGILVSLRLFCTVCYSGSILSRYLYIRSGKNSLVRNFYFFSHNAFPFRKMWFKEVVA